MASNSSFDVTTGVDYMEVHNAVDQTTKEISQRFDFKGLKVEIALNQKEKKISLAAPDENRLRAIWDVLQSKMVRRGVPLKNLKLGDAESALMGTAKQDVAIQDGLTAEMARDIVRVLKEAKLRKVQSSIQGDTVRVSSASKDELQGVIALLKQQDFGVELKFGNFRSN